MSAVTNIRDMVAAKPGAVVARLKAGDEACWQAIRLEVVHPFLAEGTVNGQRLREKRVDRDDIFDRLMEKMTVGRKLDDLRKPEAVISFLLDYTRAFVSALFERRRDRERPDGTPRARRKIVEVLVRRKDDDGDAPAEDVIESYAQPTQEEPPDGEVYESLRKSFEALWRKNPRRALVLLLRFVKRLSAGDVRAFLDLVSENYVNQVVSLAKGSMQTAMIPVADLIRRGPSDRAKRPDERKRAYGGTAFSLVFESVLAEREPFCWRAEVYVGEGAGEDDGIAISVIDGLGEPVSSGTLRFRLESLPVRDGRAPCALVRLRELLRQPEVALVTERWGAVPGRLKVE